MGILTAMEITWMTVGESAGFHADGRPYIIGIYSNPIEVRSVPLRFQLFACAKIDAQINELQRPHTLTFRLVDLDGKPTGEAHVTLQPVREAKRGIIYVIGGGQIPVPAVGRYEVQILIDGSLQENWPTWSIDFISARPADDQH